MGNFRHKTLSPFKIISFEQTPWRRITLLKDVNIVQGFGDILATTDICRVFSVWTRDSVWLWPWVLGLGDREMRMRCGLTEFVWSPQGHTHEHGTVQDLLFWKWFPQSFWNDMKTSNQLLKISQPWHYIVFWDVGAIFKVINGSSFWQRRNMLIGNKRCSVFKTGLVRVISFSEEISINRRKIITKCPHHVITTQAKK